MCAILKGLGASFRGGSSFEGGSGDPPQINSRPCMALLSKLPILARAQRRVRGAQLKARER